jgi:2-aminoethylphosphonate-pyruvate transaminase
MRSRALPSCSRRASTRAIARYAGAARTAPRRLRRASDSRACCRRLRSNSITALRFPPGRTYAALHDGLKARGFVVYEGQGRLASEVFRVANMGHLGAADFDAFLAALGEVLGA